MYTFIALISFAAGAAAGWWVTRDNYAEKLKDVAAEVRQWEGHAIADVRTFAARVRSLL